MKTATKTQAYVETSARQWKFAHTSQNAEPHAHCKRCGARIWFGQVHFKSGPAWIVYDDTPGHGGDGMQVLAKHVCKTT